VKQTEHTYIEHNNTVIALFAFQGPNGEEKGASVHVIEAGRIKSSGFYTAEPPQQIEAAKLFYEGFDQRDVDKVAKATGDGWKFIGDYGTLDIASFSAILSNRPPFDPSRRPTRKFVEQGDTVVSHWAFDGSNGVSHGAAVHRFDAGKIVESRMYASEPEEMLRVVKAYYAVFDDPAVPVANLQRIVASDYTAWISASLSNTTNSGLKTYAEFMQVAAGWAATPHAVNRTFVEQGSTVVSHYHVSVAGGQVKSGAAVHEFAKGVIKRTYFYEQNFA